MSTRRVTLVKADRGLDNGTMSGDPHLLIADDDDAIVGLLSTFFRKRGFTLTIVRNGIDARDALLAGTTDIAMLDVMMPGMTGLQALELAREAGVKTPIVIATAHGDSDAIVQALELGADDYVQKPFDLAVLHARLIARLRQAPSSPPMPVGASGASAWEEPSGPFVAAEGAVIDGRYELLRPIGKGTFGVVWRGRHRGLESDVAVKLLNIDINGTKTGTARIEPAAQTPEERQRAIVERQDELRREGVRAARVQHPNAVRVHDTGALKDGTPWLVMELIDGPTVEEVLAKSGALTVARAVALMVPVLEALAAAHDEGVIHRDVKPANVMLHQAPSGEVVKVLDFGVAKLVDVSGGETPGGYMSGEQEISNRIVAGSPAYLAPERLRGMPYDGRADVYSAGIMLYELLTGRVPFVSTGDLMKVALMHLRQLPTPPSTLNPDLPSGIDEHVLRLIEKDPAKRPTASEAADVLRDLLDFV